MPYRPKDERGNVIPVMAPETNQTVSIAAGSTSYRTASDFTREVVRVVSTVACFIKFGNSSVAATTSDMFLPANVPEYLYVGGTYDSAGNPVSYNKRLAVISASTGTLYVTELGR